MIRATSAIAAVLVLSVSVATDARAANQHLKRARQAYENLDYDDVIPALRAALKIAADDSERGEILALMAEMHILFVQEEKAIAAFVTLLQLDPAFELPELSSPRLKSSLEDARAEVGIGPPPKPPVLAPVPIEPTEVDTPLGIESPDDVAPTIVHEPCERSRPSEALEVQALFADASRLFDPHVAYRSGEAKTWHYAPFEWSVERSLFAALIPKDAIAGSLEYFIELFDEYGNGPSRMGDPEAPIRVELDPTAAACQQLGTAKSLQVIAASEAPPAVSTVAPSPRSQQPPVIPLVRAELGAALFADRPQTELFETFGISANLKAGVALDVAGFYWLEDIHAEMEVGYVGFRPKNWHRSVGAMLIGLGGGLAFAAGTDWLRPYADLHAGLARTGKLNRFLLDASAGVQLEVEWATLGPFVRYVQVFDGAGGSQVAGDAQMVLAGVAVGLQSTHASAAYAGITGWQPPRVIESPAPLGDAPGILRLPPGEPAEPTVLAAATQLATVQPEAVQAATVQPATVQPAAVQPAIVAKLPRLLDHDEDRIPDAIDECAMWSEDWDGFKDQDGCADDDNDGDLVVDSEDQCPNEPEDVDYFADADGCPEQGEGIAPDKADVVSVLPVAKRKRLRNQRVLFEFNSARTVRARPKRLNRVAAVLKEHPEALIRVEGHTDHIGSPGFNMHLSWRRARAVRRYLEGQGIPRTQLVVAGFGESRPIVEPLNGDSVRARKNRQLNRRVEFKVIGRVLE